MNFLKPLFLRRRFFYILGLIIVCYSLGFGWPAFTYAASILWILLIIFCIADWWRLAKGSRKLEAQRKCPQHFSLEDENEVVLELKNLSDKDWDCILIDELPVQFQERNFNLEFKLKSKENKNLGYRLKPLKRGKYSFGSIHIFISGKLGLVNYRKSFQQEFSVKVYPSFIQMRTFELMVFNANRSDVGIKKIRRIGHGYEFSDIRRYVFGDDPRTINWKASSRSTEIMVNNYEDEKSQQVYTLINKSRVMRMPFGGLSLMDYAINASLSILNIALRNRDNAGLMSFAKNCEEYIPARKRHNQLQLIQDSLYNMQESREEADYQSLFENIHRKIKGRSLLLMFTNFMSINSLKRVLPELQRINRRHLLVVIFFENTELEDFRKSEVRNALDIASKTMADRLSEELDQVVYELRNAGIQTIKSKPEELTANTVNKYLELKSRGMI